MERHEAQDEDSESYPASEKSGIFRFAVDMGLEVLDFSAVNSWFSGQFQLN